MGYSEEGGSHEKYNPDVEADVEAVSPGTLSSVDEAGNGKLHSKLKGRHMQMIAIGGSIGAGLFVGSGGALNSGGPASLVIDFIITGIMLLVTVNALGELACKLSRDLYFNPHTKPYSPLPCCRILLQLLCAFH